MKKLYTLALAAAVALSASAADVKTLPSHSLKVNKLERIATPTESVKMMQKSDMRKVATAETLVGQYVWRYFDVFIEDKDYTESTEIISVDLLEGDENTAVFTLSGFPIPGTVDWDNSTITFEPVRLGTTRIDATTEVYMDFYPAQVSADGSQYGASSEPMVCSFEAESITVPDLGGFCIAAMPTTAGATQPLGYFMFDLFCSFERYHDELYWTPLGDCDWNCGIMAGFYTEDATTTTTPVYKAVEDPNILRISNPFGFLFQSGTSPAAIQIDVTDPKCVLLPYQSVGFSDQDLGEIYITSLSYNYETIEDFMAEAKGLHNITLDEGHIVNFMAQSIYFNFPDAPAGSGFESNSLYTPNTQYAKPSVLSLPTDWAAVENISVESTGAVEYYNLQGVRVANPESGLYIRRAGNKATKVYLR